MFPFLQCLQLQNQFENISTYTYLFVKKTFHLQSLSFLFVSLDLIPHLLFLRGHLGHQIVCDLIWIDLCLLFGRCFVQKHVALTESCHILCECVDEQVVKAVAVHRFSPLNTSFACTHYMWPPSALITCLLDTRRKLLQLVLQE